MQEQRITLETAKFAKEKGFDIDYCQCGGFPDCICTDKSPTQSLLQKWLREEHNIHTEIRTFYRNWIFNIYDLTKLPNRQSLLHINCENDFIEFLEENNVSTNMSSYEFALEQGLQEALKLISNKN